MACHTADIGHCCRTHFSTCKQAHAVPRGCDERRCCMESNLSPGISIFVSGLIVVFLKFCEEQCCGSPPPKFDQCPPCPSESTSHQHCALSSVMCFNKANKQCVNVRASSQLQWFAVFFLSPHSSSHHEVAPLRCLPLLQVCDKVHGPADMHFQSFLTAFLAFWWKGHCRRTS